MASLHGKDGVSRIGVEKKEIDQSSNIFCWADESVFGRRQLRRHWSAHPTCPNYDGPTLTQRNKNSPNSLGHSKIRDSQVRVLGSEKTSRRLDKNLHLKYEVFAQELKTHIYRGRSARAWV